MIRRLLSMSISIVIGCLCLSSKNVALLIGIGNYNSSLTGWNVIHGNNDVVLLEKKFKDKGFAISYLVDDKATKNNIKSSLSKLVTSATTGDSIYIHFSGHGQLIADMNQDENNGYDQSFVCFDACFSPYYKVRGCKYRGQNHLIDDELFPYLNNLKKKIGKKGYVIVVFDSCYSEGADRSARSETASPKCLVDWIGTVRGTNDALLIDSATEMYLRSIKKPDSYSSRGGSITIISACMSDKRNYECKERHSGRKYGSLSYCIAKMLDLKIPLSLWGDYFSSNKYRSLNIFRPSQSPMVEFHK